MSRKLLVIDIETTGTDPLVHGVVTLGALVWNQGGIDAEYHALVNDEDALISAGAMAIHKIPLEHIREHGISPYMAVTALEQMFAKHDMTGRHVVIAAHNAPFDVGFLKRLYRLAGQDFSKRFGYRHLCTQTGALLLEQAGRLDLPGGSASLDTLTKFWNIVLDRSEGHDALADARATAAVLNRELTLMGGLRG